DRLPEHESATRSLFRGLPGHRPRFRPRSPTTGSCFAVRASGSLRHRQSGRGFADWRPFRSFTRIVTEAPQNETLASKLRSWSPNRFREFAQTVLSHKATFLDVNRRDAQSGTRAGSARSL